MLELSPTLRLIALIEKKPEETSVAELSVPVEVEMLVTVLTTVVTLETDVTPVVVEAIAVAEVAGTLVVEDDIM